MQRISTAISLAQEGRHPPDHAIAQAIAAVLHCFRREVHKTHEYATAALALSVQYEFAHWQAYVTILQGWALAMQREADEAEGIAQIRRGG